MLANDRSDIKLIEDDIAIVLRHDRAAHIQVSKWPYDIVSIEFDGVLTTY
jgi:hypothetical protein